jgi:hypothetical protein
VGSRPGLFQPTIGSKRKPPKDALFPPAERHPADGWLLCFPNVGFCQGHLSPFYQSLGNRSLGAWIPGSLGAGVQEGGVVLVCPSLPAPVSANASCGCGGSAVPLVNLVGSCAVLPHASLFRGCLERTHRVRQRDRARRIRAKGHTDSRRCSAVPFRGRRLFVSRLPGRVPGRLAGRFMHVMLSSARRLRQMGGSDKRCDTAGGWEEGGCKRQRGGCNCKGVAERLTCVQGSDAFGVLRFEGGFRMP